MSLSTRTIVLAGALVAGLFCVYLAFLSARFLLPLVLKMSARPDAGVVSAVIVLLIVAGGASHAVKNRKKRL